MNKLELFLSERMRAASAPAPHDDIVAEEERRYRRATTSQAKLSLVELAKSGLAVDPYAPVPEELKRKPGRKRTREIVPLEVRAERMRRRVRAGVFRERRAGAWRVAILEAIIRAGSALQRHQVVAWMPGERDRRLYLMNTTREVRRLQVRGYLVRTAPGRYEITDRGRDYVAMMS